MYNFNESIFTSNDLITIAHLTDFHYDPHYAPGSSSQCTGVMCCRNESTVGSEKKSSTPLINLSAHNILIVHDYNKLNHLWFYELNENNVAQPEPNSTLRAGYWGDYHMCDTPGHLVENICSQVASNHKVEHKKNKTANPIEFLELNWLICCNFCQNIGWIYYTGDFADHFNWESSRATVTRTIEFVTHQMKDKFPNTPVFMTIGNHDCHPMDA